MSNLFARIHAFSPSVKFGFLFSFIIVGMLVMMLAVVIPTWQHEQLKNETNTIEKLLTSMESQVLLTIHVNSLYNASYWEKMDLDMKNRLHELLNAWEKAPFQTQEKLMTLMQSHFSAFACNALLKENETVLYSTQNLLLPQAFEKNSFLPETWHVHDKTKRINICPAGDKEYLYQKPIPKSPYTIALVCQTQEFLKSRSDFEASIGSMLKQSFQNFKNHTHGFAYMMWVDGSDRQCDHNASFRKSHSTQAPMYNTACCVSESSPTDQPLTGELKASDFLHAASKHEPIRHLLPKQNDASNKLYPALTWVHSFKGNREYPFLLVATLYEDEIYQSLEPITGKFLPAIFITLGSAFLLGWLVFRRFAYKIDRLLYVAKTVQRGNLTERSHIKGEDDISILAKTFDAMLDSLHENIDLLDSKVADRTAQLEALLQEKEVLLKEIHHRVKNNLSIVIALMQLKENQAISEESQSLLIELQERIYAIELLHRQLYQSTSLKDIAFDVYVKGLMQSMATTYDFETKNIAMHLDIEPMYLGIEQALACGLIINECVTNAIKHAFSEQGGTISLTFACHDARYTLVISDNGKGLAQNFNLSAEQGLGMQLIQGIVTQQLQGHLTLTSTKGTCFSIHFKP